MGIWYIGGFVVMMVFGILDWPPFSWFEAEQMQLFGSYNMVVAMLPMLAVLMVPVVIVLSRRNWSSPLLVGARHALVGGGPLVRPYRTLTRMSVGFGVAAVVLVSGLGLATWLRYGVRPAAASVDRTYADLLTPGPQPRNINLIHAARAAGDWVERYSVRRDRHIEIYRPITPDGGTLRPVRILLRDSFNPDYASTQPPAALTGSIESSPLASWRVSAIRAAGIPVSDDVIVIDHHDFSDGVVDDRWLDAIIPTILAVAFACSFGVTSWAMWRRRQTYLPDD